MKLTTTKTPVTAKQRVLKVLNSGKWIDRFTIEDDNVGGVSGMRRLRELRSSGLNIVKRAHPDYINEFQYRLVKK